MRRFRQERRGGLAKALAVAMLFGVFAAATVPARALEATCIEASRYKYLYRLFDNDRARFAAFFGADEKKLPSPETCRAVILTGSIDKPERGSKNDFDRLLDAITEGRGWLSTLYLASPGGNVGMGLRLANLTRMFWLNTYAVDGPAFDYVPDFLSANGPGSPPGELPPEFARGWESYREAIGAMARVELEDRRSRRCVSACTFLHTAGIHRYGPAYFHRARRGRSHTDAKGNITEPSSMAEMLEGLQKTEQRIVAHLRKMDSGEAAIQAYQSTATQTTSRAEIPAFPRYIDDYLTKLCHTQPRKPRRPRTADTPAPQESAARSGDTAPPAPEAASPLQTAGPQALSAEARQCLAAANSRERLKQFDKLCYDGCDHATLLHEAANRVRALTPREQREEPQRQRARER